MPACKQLFQKTIWPFVRTTVGSTVRSTPKASQYDTKATAPPLASPVSGKFRRLAEFHGRDHNSSPETDEFELINVNVDSKSDGKISSK